MLSIFSPRKTTAPGLDNFDKYYLDYEIKDVVKPLEGTDDFIIEKKIIVSKRDIVEYINSQADDVGLDAMLRRFNQTGDSSCLPQPVQASDEILDLTKLPQDNAEYFAYIHKLADDYEKLPLELRKDMSMDEFVKRISNDDIYAYFDAMKKTNEVKEDVVNE